MRGCVILTLLIATTAQATDYWHRISVRAGVTELREDTSLNYQSLILPTRASNHVELELTANLAGEYYAGELFVVGEDGDVFLAGLLHAGNDYSFWDCYSEPVLFLDLHWKSARPGQIALRTPMSSLKSR